MSSLRDQDQPGQAGRVRDVVLPRLPALRNGTTAVPQSTPDPIQGIFRTWPTNIFELFRLLSRLTAAAVVPNFDAIPARVSFFRTVYVVLKLGSTGGELLPTAAADDEADAEPDELGASVDVGPGLGLGRALAEADAGAFAPGDDDAPPAESRATATTRNARIIKAINAS
jgi:hypothetical protein